MNKISSLGLFRVFLAFGMILVFVVLGFAFFFFSSAPVSAAIFASLTPTQENLFALADVPKPTYTPTSTPTPAPTATEAPGIMDMQAIADTPIPILPTDAPALVVDQPVYSGAKYVLVDISDQHMYVYEGDTLIYSFVASTGMNNATRTGTFAVQSKIANAYGSTWDIWMPYWLGIYWSGGLENGIHALPVLSNGAVLWQGYLGRPISYGCVVLGTYEASLLYDWAQVGTTVEIRW